MKYLLFLFVGLAATGCLEVQNPYSALPPGKYRGVLRLEPKMARNVHEPVNILVPEFSDLKYDEVTNGELPFGMEVIYNEAGTEFHIELINGEERIRVDDIAFGWDRQLTKDTLILNFPVYDTYVTALTEGGVIEGDWVVNYKQNYRIPFVAMYGEDYRFTQLQKPPVTDLSGTWAVEFSPDDDPYAAVGEFQQEGNRVTGTFRTETGDYRFLEGEIQADKLYLSVFDGSHAFLFEAKVAENEMVGTFRSGKHYRTIWTARRDANATLPSADSLTYLNPGYDAVDFSFPLPDGGTLSPNNPEFAGKPKLVQIMGTWCPNCRDETNFLRDYRAKHPEQDFEIMAIAFERYRDPARSMAALRTYGEQMNVDYPIALGGYYDKGEAGKALPMLNHVLSYPTLLFLDAENRVRHIHTGFSGPATSTWAEFQTEFEQRMRELTTAPADS